jgi:iron complex outermembrane receptor protein
MRFKRTWLSLLAASPALVFAEDSKVIELAPVIVTSSPFNKGQDALSKPVDVIRGRELDRARAGNVGETLEQRLGVSNSDFGQGAGRPVIRGQAGPRVLILENGVATQDASTVSADHAVTVDVSQAEQIEIIKGPATLRYGSSASAGAVNVVNNRLPHRYQEGFRSEGSLLLGTNAQEKQGRVELDYGQNRTQFHADLAGRDTGEFSIPGAQNSDGSGRVGKVNNSQVSQASGAVSITRFSEAGSKFGAAYSFFDTEYGLPLEESAFIDLRQRRLDVFAQVSNPFAGFESASVRGATSRYEHVEFEAPDEPGTRFENEEHDIRSEAIHVPIAGWRGALGLQYNDRDFAAIGEEAFVPRTRTRQAAIYALEERPSDLGLFEVGLRIESLRHRPDNQAERSFTPVSLSAGQRFDLNDQYHLRINAARNQRAPAIEELFAFGPHKATATFERGDRNLKLETTHNLEVSLDRHQGAWTYSITAFADQARNYIFLKEAPSGQNADGSAAMGGVVGEAGRVDEEGNFDPAGELLLADFQQRNARFTGLEVETRVKLIDAGSQQASLRLWGDTVRGKLSGNDNLPRISPSRLGFNLTGQWQAFSGEVAVTQVFDQNRVANLESRTNGYTLLAMDVEYRLSSPLKASLFVRGRNLLDEDVRRHTSFLKDVAPAAGRSGFAGVRVSF